MNQSKRFCELGEYEALFSHQITYIIWWFGLSVKYLSGRLRALSSNPSAAYKDKSNRLAAWNPREVKTTGWLGGFGSPGQSWDLDSNPSSATAHTNVILMGPCLGIPIKRKPLVAYTWEIRHMQKIYLI